MKRYLAVAAVFAFFIGLVYLSYGQQSVPNTVYGTPTLPTSLETSGNLGVGGQLVSGQQATVTVGATSTIGVVVAAPASQSADLQRFTVNSSTVARIGAIGGMGLVGKTATQINTLVPDFLGEVIVDVNGNFPFNLCVATGTAAGQWMAIIQSTGGFSPSAAALGGTRQFGCGTGN